MKDYVNSSSVVRLRTELGTSASVSSRYYLSFLCFSLCFSWS